MATDGARPPLVEIVGGAVERNRLNLAALPMSRSSEALPVFEVPARVGPDSLPDNGGTARVQDARTGRRPHRSEMRLERPPPGLACV